MRKYGFLLSVLMVVMSGCGSNEKTAEAASEVGYDSVAWCDSVVLPGGSSVRVDYACVFPEQGGTALADSVRLWVCEQFGDSVYEPEKDVRGMVVRKGMELLEEEKMELLILNDIRDATFFPLCYEHERNVRIEYDDEEYTTLACVKYDYMAGAHGSTSVRYATFRKSDGHRMDWELLAGMSREEIVAAIKQGLCGYFDTTMEKLPDDLLLGSIDEEEVQRIFRDEFPLPSTPPYLTKDGVGIIYQQYEICCYAAGMPECIIKPTKE